MKIGDHVTVLTCQGYFPAIIKDIREDFNGQKMYYCQGDDILSHTTRPIFPQLSKEAIRKSTCNICQNKCCFEEKTS